MKTLNNSNEEKFSLNSFQTNSSLTAEIYSGGIFSIFNENISPEIYNISPAFKSKYKSEDLNKVSFISDDLHSGINHNSIIVKIDNEILYYSYIPYRNTVECNIDKKLDIGEHTLEIYIEDKIFNSNYKKGIFYIE